MQMIHVLVSN